MEQVRTIYRKHYCACCANCVATLHEESFLVKIGEVDSKIQNLIKENRRQKIYRITPEGKIETYYDNLWTFFL